MKKFYQTHFANEWIQAMQELDAIAPLTSYCASTYKADLTLGSILQDHPHPNSALAYPSPSCSLTPSSLTASHVAPSSVVPSSNMAPPSTIPSHAGSSCVTTASHSSSITAASHTSHQSPHCAAPKSTLSHVPSEA